jgi:hypothetical protein
MYLIFKFSFSTNFSQFLLTPFLLSKATKKRQEAEVFNCFARKNNSAILNSYSLTPCFRQQELINFAKLFPEFDQWEYQQY